MAKRMSRKKFVKKMMSVGISRNAANWAARIGTEEAMRTLAMIMSQPPYSVHHQCGTEEGWLDDQGQGVFYGVTVGATNGRPPALEVHKCF